MLNTIFIVVLLALASEVLCMPVLADADWKDSRSKEEQQRKEEWRAFQKQLMDRTSGLSVAELTKALYSNLPVDRTVSQIITNYPCATPSAWLSLRDDDIYLWGPDVSKILGLPKPVVVAMIEKKYVACALAMKAGREAIVDWLMSVKDVKDPSMSHFMVSEQVSFSANAIPVTNAIPDREVAKWMSLSTATNLACRVIAAKKLCQWCPTDRQAEVIRKFTLDEDPYIRKMAVEYMTFDSDIPMQQRKAVLQGYLEYRTNHPLSCTNAACQEQERLWQQFARDVVKRQSTPEQQPPNSAKTHP
jgi:hypothetical protein